ncbi:MAG: D-alanyl-D-alanine carboxypeptidase family protein [Candidatus Binataceae bacterium]
MKRNGSFTVVSVVILSFAISMMAGPANAARHRRHKPAAEAPPAVALSQVHVLGDRPAPFVLDARAAYLMDARSGAVLYAYNEHEKIQPASLTKIMTFYLTLKALHSGRFALNTEVPVSEKAWRLSMNQSVSRMFLQVGQKVPMRDLLYGLVVSSGNDAAVTLAEYQAGSTGAFTELMNKTAAQLGLTETHFENPDGLPMPGEYTTAADMAKLARIVIEQYHDALNYTSTKEFTFDNIRQRNFNTLLFYDARVNGFKTGHVQEAGYHLVASAHEDGTELISAVLGTPSSEKRRTETEKLIDWAFRTFATVHPDWHKAAPSTLRVYEGVAPEAAIAPASVPYVTVGRGEERKVTLTSSMSSKYLVAPVAKGATVGELTMMVDGKPQASIPLRTQAAVAEGGLFHRLADKVRMRL